MRTRFSTVFYLVHSSSHWIVSNRSLNSLKCDQKSTMTCKNRAQHARWWSPDFMAAKIVAASIAWKIAQHDVGYRNRFDIIRSITFGNWLKLSEWVLSRDRTDKTKQQLWNLLKMSEWTNAEKVKSNTIELVRTRLKQNTRNFEVVWCSHRIIIAHSVPHQTLWNLDKRRRSEKKSRVLTKYEHFPITH